MMKTKYTNEKMLDQKEYIAPYEITKRINNQLREEKLSQTDLRAKIRDQVQYEMPRSSKEKIEAEVVKRLE